MMKRRLFLVATTSVWLSPGLAGAQQRQPVPRIGFLSIAPATIIALDAERFQAGLRELGYVEGRNIHVEYRYADDDIERLTALAKELVARKVDIIVTYSSLGLMAAHRATASIPIVLAVGPDPVELGLAKSLARPGGNVTGTSIFLPEVGAKQLELLKQLDPAITRTGVMMVRGSPSNALILKALRPTAAALGLELIVSEVSDATEFEQLLLSWQAAKVQAAMVVDSPLFSTGTNAERLAALAIGRKLPLIGNMVNCRSGALLGYGVDIPQLYFHSARFVDRILKGARAGDLPIEQPTKFPLLVNLKTAAALGVTVPPILLARSDEVIE